MNDYWKPSATVRSSQNHQNSRRQPLSLSVIHFNCRFQVTWPFFAMAPRNIPACNNVLTPCKHRKLSPTYKGEPVANVNWQKTVIQSSVVEKFDKNWCRIRNQSWIEQMRMMIKETPATFSSIICMAMLCLCILPVAVFLTLVLGSFFFTLFSFVFFEGTLLTVATLMLGALLSLVFFVAFPFIAVVVTVYFLASIAFNLLGSTTSKIKRMMVVGESQVPMCIVDSDTAILRRAHTKSFQQPIDLNERKFF